MRACTRVCVVRSVRRSVAIDAADSSNNLAREFALINIDLHHTKTAAMAVAGFFKDETLIPKQ